MRQFAAVSRDVVRVTYEVDVPLRRPSEFLRSAEGAARTLRPARNCFAPPVAAGSAASTTKLSNTDNPVTVTVGRDDAQVLSSDWRPASSDSIR
jgi:hypothetical protein